MSGPPAGSAGGHGPEAAAPAAPDRATTYREVFAVREYRPLFGSLLMSAVGDELARLALTVLVYERTRSPLLAALTFGMTFLPWLLGGPLLTALADRLPRKRLVVGCDVVRAVLVLLLTVPGMPLWILLALLFVISLCGPPFESARLALTADVLEDDRYAVAVSLQTIVGQAASVAGLLLGGALVAVGPTVALLVDAATFAASALWLHLGLRNRPAPVSGGGTRQSLVRDTVEGLRFLAGNPRARAVIGLLWVGSAFVYAPDGVMTPLTAQLGQAPGTAGVLLAAGPMGTILGSVLVGRAAGPLLRERMMAPLVVLSLVPLAAAGVVVRTVGPGTAALVAVTGLLAASGIGAAWLIPLNSAFVDAVPAAMRGRAFGVAVTGLNGSYGLGIVVGGLAAEGVSPAAVMALCGAVGLLAVAGPLVGHLRTRPHVAAAEPAAGPSRA